MKAEILAILLLFLIGVYGDTRNCYKCNDEVDPLKSDCWNNTAKDGAIGVEIVSCEYACFSETFQSGGDWWYVTKGCSKGSCAGSNNCNGPHWGKCMKCCKGDLCNTEAPGTAVRVTVSITLSIVALVVARFL
ncbi:uncharacterized protein [Amphiura filiformis]|uniref:uncharacterized protein n=1 Tax=Amphiura filiformis TaxID=82378 RepID=UPI003B222F63